MTDISKLVAGYKRRIDKLVQVASETTAHEMIERAPVLSGSLVLSFTGSINNQRYRPINLPVPPNAVMPYGLWDNPRAGQYKATAKQRASSVAGRMSSRDSFTYISGQPHGPAIEYGAHSYRKAPAGFRGVAVAQWGKHVKDAARRARGI